MADNYLQYAEAWKLEPACVTWLQTFLDACNEGFDSLPEDMVKVLEAHYWDTSDLESAVSVIVGEFSLNGSGSELYVASESGDVELVAGVLHEMLKATGSDEILSFTWATTCSKMRPGEFGGGVAVISKEGTEIESSSWRGSKLEKLILRRRAKARK